MSRSHILGQDICVRTNYYCLHLAFIQLCNAHIINTNREKMIVGCRRFNALGIRQAIDFDYVNGNRNTDVLIVFKTVFCIIYTGKGKVLYGQAPPRGESTTTE